MTPPRKKPVSGSVAKAFKPPAKKPVSKPVRMNSTSKRYGTSTPGTSIRGFGRNWKGDSGY